MFLVKRVGMEHDMKPYDTPIKSFTWIIPLMLYMFNVWRVKNTTCHHPFHFPNWLRDYWKNGHYTGKLTLTSVMVLYYMGKPISNSGHQWNGDGWTKEPFLTWQRLIIRWSRLHTRKNMTYAALPRSEAFHLRLDPYKISIKQIKLKFSFEKWNHSISIFLWRCHVQLSSVNRLYRQSIFLLAISYNIMSFWCQCQVKNTFIRLYINDSHNSLSRCHWMGADSQINVFLAILQNMKMHGIHN